MASFSAPRIEAEELEEERLQLPEHRKAELLRDLHGTESANEENPQFLNQKLQLMENQIGEIPNEKKEMFLRAQELCNEYVNSVKHRLLFLRQNQYDVQRAAKALVQFWNVKYDLMGEEGTFHRMTLNDLSPLEQDILISGPFRLMPDRDKTGRAIIVSDRFKWYSNKTDESRRSMLKVVFYMALASLEDEEVQRIGVVLIFGTSQIVRYDMFDRKLTRQLAQVIFPGFIHMNAMHFCYKGLGVIQFLVPIVLYIIGSDYRERVQIHTGTIQDMISKLEEFGMSASSLPTDIGGGLAFSQKDWVEDRRKRNL